MFYVSSISGSQVPFDPRITPIATRIESIVQTAALVSAAEIAVPEAISQVESLQFQEALTKAQILARLEEAVVYEGANAPTTSDLVGGSNALDVARAGAAMAYRVQESENVEEAPAPEGVLRAQPAHESDHVDSKPHEPPGRVNPISRSGYGYRPSPRERKRVVTAADIMSSPVFCLNEDKPIEEAQRIFRERKYRHIPIVSAASNLVGILSDRDFIGTGSSGPSKQIIIKGRMVTNILTARPNAEIRAIAEVMIDHRIGCLPIVDDSGLLVGILTRSDILRAIVNHAPIELWT